MRLKDADIEACQAEKLANSMIAHGVEKELVESNSFLELYFEALAFIVGLHPKGRFVLYEDLVVSSTEQGLKAFMGPYISADQRTWCYEPSDELKKSNLEFNTRQGYVMAPDEFIEMFVSANLYGEGTPPYVTNKIL
jgi:hypothetical protein